MQAVGAVLAGVLAGRLSPGATMACLAVASTLVALALNPRSTHTVACPRRATVVPMRATQSGSQAGQPNTARTGTPVVSESAP